MLTSLKAPVKIRLGIVGSCFGVAVLLFVETSSHCAQAQQSTPDGSEDVQGEASAPEVSSDDAQARERAEAKAEQQEALSKENAKVVECQRLVALVVGKVAVPEIYPEVLAKSTSENTSVQISLSERLLLVEIGGVRALSCPIACGRSGMDTETGKFRVASKSERAPADFHYGSLVDSQGNLLLKGVYSDLDPLPVGATFVASPPNVYITLTEGVVIHSGDANGTLSSNGAIVIPTSVARTLLKILKNGTSVSID